MKCCALLLSLLLCLGLTGCAPAEVEIPAIPVQAAEAAEPPKPPPRRGRLSCGPGLALACIYSKSQERRPAMPTHQYDDILNLPRPVSRRHRPMPIEERAVQFAPFAALTSYEEILMEAARPTRDCSQLSEDEQTRLDARLQLLRERIKERPWATVTWFVPDEKKAGGNCVTKTGQVMKLREQPPALLLSEGEEIPLERMLALELIENPG